LLGLVPWDEFESDYAFGISLFSRFVLTIVLVKATDGTLGLLCTSLTGHGVQGLGINGS
jgi:hypothetical protein